MVKKMRHAGALWVDEAEAVEDHRLDGMACGHHPHCRVLLGGFINDLGDAKLFKHARDTVALQQGEVLFREGESGEELFAVAAHGYSAKMLDRLGPIARTMDNATAAAWRLGEVRIVTGDSTSNGAIVAPMFGPESCIGALAAEVRHGRETDSATQAVTAMIAAQLASIVAAWPAASVGGVAEAAAKG